MTISAADGTRSSCTSWSRPVGHTPAHAARGAQSSCECRWIDLGSLWAVPAAGEQTVVVQTSYGLPIGWVQSVLRVLDDAPNQREGAPRAWIRFDEQVAEGAMDLRPGDEVVVLTWLHLSPRDELSTHPEDDMSLPLTGVFSTCSPNRPNPIGLHRARIVTRDGLRIEVDALEAVDGTPVVDVKPAIDPPA
jgi:tRNA-Thr(GGU) m(6)t(6)A37 methyltransferase TsaA